MQEISPMWAIYLLMLCTLLSKIREYFAHSELITTTRRVDNMKTGHWQVDNCGAMWRSYGVETGRIKYGR